MASGEGQHHNRVDMKISGNLGWAGIAYLAAIEHGPRLNFAWTVAGAARVDISDVLFGGMGGISVGVFCFQGR